MCVPLPLKRKSYSSSLFPIVWYNHLPEIAVMTKKNTFPALTRVLCQDDRRQCACCAGGAEPLGDGVALTPHRHVTYRYGKLKRKKWMIFFLSFFFCIHKVINAKVSTWSTYIYNCMIQNIDKGSYNWSVTHYICLYLHSFHHILPKKSRQHLKVAFTIKTFVWHKRYIFC